jgi:hypothetical protein
MIEQYISDMNQCTKSGNYFGMNCCVLHKYILHFPD